MTEKDWYDLQELANEWHIAIVRLRRAVVILEVKGVIETRESPTDKRAKQISSGSVEALRKTVGP
jgi:DNA-binding MarR family transcriptional regulator